MSFVDMVLRNEFEYFRLLSCEVFVSVNFPPERWFCSANYNSIFFAGTSLLTGFMELNLKIIRTMSCEMIVSVNLYQLI